MRQDWIESWNHGESDHNGNPLPPRSPLFRSLTSIIVTSHYKIVDLCDYKEPLFFDSTSSFGIHGLSYFFHPLLLLITALLHPNTTMILLLFLTFSAIVLLSFV